MTMIKPTFCCSGIFILRILSSSLIITSHHYYLMLCNAFIVTPTSPTSCTITTSTSFCHQLHRKINLFQIYSQSNKNYDFDDDDSSWDSPEDYNDNPSSSSKRKKNPSLGINIKLEPLTPEQAQSLKSEATQKINQAFDGRLQEIEKMKLSIQKDFEQSKKSLQYASDLRAKDETEKLMNKIDRISNKFLEENEELRMGTKLAAKADRINAKEGRGLEVGSWGSIGSMNVGMMTTMGNGLLGSVGSAAVVQSVSNDDDEEEDTSTTSSNNNRIMIICDDKQDQNVQKVINQFQTILTSQFTSPVFIDTYKPTDNIPMGGSNAQCVIISSTSLSNGQSSANNILSRILRRTISPGGGKVNKPPSHFVVVSPLGTERIDKFPYSMTNMMNGNKLKKAREVEEVIISTVKGRLVADSGNVNGPPLDYTIIKFGDIVNDDKLNGSSKQEGMILAPGDSLDGKVGIEAAANSLFQAVALRPTARNATLSVIGGMSDNKGVDEYQWEDWFLRLDGPELWRREGLLINEDDESIIDRKFEQLSNYIIEWSDMFNNGAKGTGLTTPVSVVPGKYDMKNESLSIRSKYGLRLEFKQTMTGAAYKSKSEEKQMESQRSDSSYAPNKPQQKSISSKRPKREGGVEIMIEKTEDINGKFDLRVRARRCNMDDNTVVKELSEETILKKLSKAIEVWTK